MASATRTYPDLIFSSICCYIFNSANTGVEEIISALNKYIIQLKYYNIILKISEFDNLDLPQKKFLGMCLPFRYQIKFYVSIFVSVKQRRHCLV